MWSKKPIPLVPVKRPLPSRLSVSSISVSLVVRRMVDSRIGLAPYRKISLRVESSARFSIGAPAETRRRSPISRTAMPRAKSAS